MSADASAPTGGAPAATPAAPAATPAALAAPAEATPAAVAPETPGAPAAGSEAPWYHGHGELSAEHQAFLENKGLSKDGKGLADLVGIAQWGDRIRGVSADKLAQIPNWENPEEVSAFNQRMGVPESADGYQMEPIALSNGAEFDMAELSSLAHQIDLQPHQAPKFAAMVKTWFDKSIQEQTEARIVRDAAQKQDWEREQGKALTESEYAVIRARQTNPVLDEHFDTIQAAIGYKAAREMANAFARGTGEHVRGDNVPGSSSGGSFEPTQEVAREQVKQLRSDKEFGAKLLAGDVEAKQKWERLNQIAAGR